MKLKSLYSFLLATALVACNEDFNEDIAGVQKADPETPASAISFSATAASQSTIDFGTLEEGTTTVKVCSFSATPSTETTTVTHVLDLRDADNNSYKFDLTANGEASVEELQALIESVYGKRPTERSFEAYVYEYLNTNGQTLIGKSELFTILLTPKAPFISEAYYLVGGMCGWSTADAIKFGHSGKDVYEDPIFTLIFTAGDECWWKIISQSNMDAGSINVEGVIGVKDGDTSLSGKLIFETPGAGKIEDGGMYRMTLNMMDGTYELKKIAPIYHLLGDITAWGADAKNAAFYPTTDKIHTYTTDFTKADNSAPYLKFILAADMEALANNDWSGVYGGEDGSQAENAPILGGNPGAFRSPGTGYYTLTIDMKNMEYTWTKLDNQTPAEFEFISLIGDFNSWGADVDLTQVTPHNWYIENFTVAADGGLKFRSGHDWGDNPNWGAAANIGDTNYGEGVKGGANITVPAGTYNIYFNDITGKFLFVTVE